MYNFRSDLIDSIRNIRFSKYGPTTVRFNPKTNVLEISRINTRNHDAISLVNKDLELINYPSIDLLIINFEVIREAGNAEQLYVIEFKIPKETK